MKITDIKQQVHRQGRYSIYADGKYCFSLSEAELLRSEVRIGQVYNSEQLNELLTIANEDKAYSRALDYLARRPRSEWELTDYLRRKQYPGEVITKILNKLRKKGMLDDAKFAQSWIESRNLTKPTSKRKLQLELRKKRVPQNIIDGALANFDDQELVALQHVIEKKRRLRQYQDPLKLTAYLARQGFAYEQIKAALSATDID